MCWGLGELIGYSTKWDSIFFMCINMNIYERYNISISESLQNYGFLKAVQLMYAQLFPKGVGFVRFFVVVASSMTRFSHIMSTRHIIYSIYTCYILDIFLRLRRMWFWTCLIKFVGYCDVLFSVYTVYIIVNVTCMWCDVRKFVWQLDGPEHYEHIWRCFGTEKSNLVRINDERDTARSFRVIIIIVKMCCISQKYREKTTSQGNATITRIREKNISIQR